MVVFVGPVADSMVWCAVFGCLAVVFTVVMLQSWLFGCFCCMYHSRKNTIRMCTNFHGRYIS